MNARFHLLDNDAFIGRIPGDAPSDAELKVFKSPELKKGMSEHDIHLQLGAVVQSVLDAAECTKLQFLGKAHHKSKVGKHGRTATFNDAGIYRDTTFAHDATNLNAKPPTKSKTCPKQRKERLLEARSSFWVDVPVEVTGDEKSSAFYFETEPDGPLDASDQPGPAGSHGDQKQAVVENQHDGRLREEKEEPEVIEEADQAEADEDAETKGDRDSLSDDSEDSEADDEDEDSESDVLGTPEDSGHSTHDAVLSFLKKHYPPFVNVTDDGLKALDQFVERQLQIFKFQHRTFCYSIYICFDMARLLYFDRAGAYVSHPFSWVEPTSLLHEFVWKFAQFANADKLGKMGHDPTATVVSAETRQCFVKQAKNAALAPHIRAGLKKASENGCPLYELVVQDVAPSRDEWFPDEPFPEPPNPPSSSSQDSSSGDATALILHRFIVGRPHFAADTIVGRCTRGYMTFDVTDPKKWVPCFLKDSWRACVPHRTRPEHLVYERLKRKGVNPADGIATMICGGDVGGFRAQRTRVQKDLPDANRPIPRIHYRLVTKDIGLPLWEFEHFGELSKIFVGALRGHRLAWNLAGILHRDVSVGNIMILTHNDGSRSGFLIDWDLSRLECELAKGPVEPDRTGTWQFRSALSLRYPRKPYRRSDDVESFIYVYVYVVLRYHRTSAGSLRTKVENLFQAVSHIDGIKIGGDDKISMLRAGQLGFEITGNKNLQKLLNYILENCKATYANVDYPEMERLYGPTQATEQPAPLAQQDVPQEASPPPQTPPESVLRDDEVPNDDESLRRRARMWGLEEDDEPAPPTDPCKIGSFLEDPLELMRTLAEHARRTRESRDKGADQFLARKSQDVFRPAENDGRRNIGEMSLAGSFSSEEAFVNPLAAPQASDAEVSPANSVASFDQHAHSYDVPPAISRQKRIRADEEDDDSGEDSYLPRRSKRAKTRSRKGKACA